MSPGMITGCPISRYAAGVCGMARRKARVAPLRCTHTPVAGKLFELGDVVAHVVDGADAGSRA